MQTLEQLRKGELKGTNKLKLSCNLTEFPLEILDLAPSLEVLDLSGNKLTSLPEEFAQLKNLKIAFFSDNDFTHFPAVLAKCPQLEMIGFKACKITRIEEDAIPDNTRWLILTNNRIQELPKSIGNCSRMQKLMLAGNCLQQLPDELAACKALELLRISANAITSLPDWLLSSPRLAWLACSGNFFNKAQTVDTILPEIPWSELVVEEQLGEGASGIISKAIWEKRVSGAGAATVAVKVFKGEVTSDGLPQDEMITCMAAGAHPNLVEVLGKITEHPEGKQGLVLALIPEVYRNLGGPPNFETCTRDVYSSDTAFSLPDAVNIASGIASAAAHLHKRGLMHGDLYAHNTLVNPVGHPLLGDFGAATLYNKADTGKATALERIEVRAFGCLLEDLLYHLSPKDATHKFVPALLQLIEACMQEHVLQRPDFNIIISQLEEVAKELPIN